MQKGSKATLVKEKQEKAALEAGFSNYFSGANHDRALQKDKERRERSRSKNIPKQSDDRPKRGWHEKDQHPHHYGGGNLTRTSTDRYSQHSEDEEIEPHNKVDFNR